MDAKLFFSKECRDVREQPSTSGDHAWNSVEITIQDSEHMDK